MAAVAVFAFGAQRQRHIDDHVFLATDVAEFADALQDFVRRHAIALLRLLRVQQEGRVDARISLRDRGAIHPRHARQHRTDHVVSRGHDPIHVDVGADTQPLEGRGDHLSRCVARSRAESAQRSVDLLRPVLGCQHRVRHSQREVLVTVEADLGLRADLVVQRLDAGLRLTQDQRSRRVDDVYALRSGIDHDARLLGKLCGIDAVREHEEADGLHPEFTCRGEVLERGVRLGAVGRDPRDRRTALVGVLEVVDGSDAGQQKHSNTSTFRLLDRAADESELVGAGEPVVEARAAETVAV